MRTSITHDVTCVKFVSYITRDNNTAGIPDFGVDVLWLNSSNERMARSTNGGFSFPYNSNNSMDLDAGTYHIEIVQRSLAIGTNTGTYFIAVIMRSSSTGTYTLTVPTLHTPVSNITLASSTTAAGTNLILTGTVTPSNATNRTITWSVVNAGTTT